MIILNSGTTSLMDSYEKSKIKPKFAFQVKTWISFHFVRSQQWITHFNNPKNKTLQSNPERRPPSKTWTTIRKDKVTLSFNFLSYYTAIFQEHICDKEFFWLWEWGLDWRHGPLLTLRVLCFVPKESLHSLSPQMLGPKAERVGKNNKWLSSPPV